MSSEDHRTEFVDLGEALRIIADRKANSAKSRHLPVNDSIQKPHDVFMVAAETLAESLKPSGFRFLKSGPSAVRMRNGRREEIWFDSSRHNVRGQYVQLATGILVRDEFHRRWQADVGSPFAHEAVFGGNIGNVDNGGYVTWDIASDIDRPAVLAEVAERIRSVALPFFDLFDYPSALMNRITCNRPVACDEEFVIELLVRHAGREAASAYVRQRIDDECSLSEVRAEIDQLEAGQLLEESIGGWVRTFALAIHAFKLDLLSDG